MARWRQVRLHGSAVHLKDDAHPEVRVSAMRALGGMPPEVQAIHAAAVAAQLGDALSHVRAAAAEALGVSRKTLSAVLNGKAGISPEMAIRLSIAFDTSAESWLNQQSQYELWHAEQHRKELNVKKLVAA